MFPINPLMIDKSLPVPVGMQLHGLLSYALSFWNLPEGEKLPSVRQLAADLGVAPMTVAQVYQQLRDEGLIEMRAGLGAFVARRAAPEADDPIAGLAGMIDALLRRAHALDVSPTALVGMVNARAQLQRSDAGLKVVFVGMFGPQTRDYVREIASVLAPTDSISWVLMSQLTDDLAARDSCLGADLVVTFTHRVAEVRSLLEADGASVDPARVVGIAFIASRRTRQQLAGQDPRARIAAVSYFQEYVSVMRPTVREFAPHVAEVRATWMGAADLNEVLAGCTSVVYASGAEHLSEMVEPGVDCFEFRHSADQAALEGVLLPHLAKLRQAKVSARVLADSQSADDVITK
ncbi:transcriptional regulator, GntR family [Ketogulonicigenium robustum]|uniref:Transcriptional regulator, GntR family n=1 Tax=Ketogulonicigenium robustum TaxID=92947 RepID=A0A1W6NZF3_9RHOB|nr:GntR family transcriptional regulator [Ketogulonicigenium robustum]ARO14636.1 transcriptional regulator, GntR family [Ketogulonicigenium robustum]